MSETATSPSETGAPSVVLLSESAAREVNNIVEQQELDGSKIRLRVGVKGGGCSGFSYLLDLTESQKETDEVWQRLKQDYPKSPYLTSTRTPAP